MSFNVDKFRENFPEFASITNYPESMIEFWADIAALQLNQDRWGDMLTYGTQLYVAHQITLHKKNIASAAAGGAPGASGLLSNQSAGSVSVGIDTGSTTEERGGQWNLTNYGTQFLRLARIIGIGGVQL